MGVTNLETGNPKRVAASGAWVDENNFVAVLRFYETPFALTLNFRFLGDQLWLDSRMNVAFGAAERPQLIGSAS